MASCTARQHPTPRVVIALPTEIDLVNADAVRDQLLAALDSAATVVIADLTLTAYCDSTGFRSLAVAHREASSTGKQLQVTALPGAAIDRTLKLLELDQMLHVFPSVSAALAGRAPD